MAALPYIQLYIADYLADTMHLQAEEHGAYLLLIFNYWQTAKPIPKNRLQAIARVSNERWTDVERTLNEFFNDTGTHWQHDRIDSDLSRVEEKQSQAVRAGKASAAARKAKNKQKSGSLATGVPTDVPAGVPIPLEQNGNHKDTDTDTDTDNKKTKQKKRKPESWKLFFDAYPENKKGGTDATAWKAAQREGLDDEDFEAMLADVEKRKRLCVSWYSTYALGITRYISERFWLTPVTPEIPKTNGEPNESVTDAEFFGNLDPEIAGRLFAQPASDIPGLEGRSVGRSSSVDDGIQAPAAKRVC